MGWGGKAKNPEYFTSLGKQAALHGSMSWTESTIHLCLLCINSSPRRKSRSFGRGSVMSEVIPKKNVERKMCKDEAPGTNLSEYRLSLTQGKGVTGYPGCHVRIILWKKIPGVSTLPRSPFPFQLILMLVQSYLNANFSPLSLNGQNLQKF